MALSNSLKRKLQTVLYILLVWLVLGLYIVIYNHLLIASAEAYDFWNSVITTMAAVIFAGIIAGNLIVFVLREQFQRLPLGLGLVLYALTFIFLITVITVIASFLYNSLNMNLPYYHELVINDVKRFLLNDYGFLLNLMTWSTIAFLTILSLQVNDNYGQGVFKNMLLGRYHQPKQEDRIFMFLDIKSSTRIAEQVGNIQYFKLLSKFFSDISSPVLEYGGEIYQYVGDEVVVSWPLKRGLKNSQALKCFFAIQNAISAKAGEYQKLFGLVPGFKAGLHFGEVTIGEVGSIKKDIIFSGDVLNTTSRIQDLCNKFGVNLLVSRKLLDLMPQASQYQVKKLEEISLRGKERPVALCSVQIDDIPEVSLTEQISL